MSSLVKCLLNEIIEDIKFGKIFDSYDDLEEGDGDDDGGGWGGDDGSGDNGDDDSSANELDDNDFLS